jgi:hypothetical protein
MNTDYQQKAIRANRIYVGKRLARAGGFPNMRACRGARRSK